MPVFYRLVLIISSLGLCDLVYGQSFHAQSTNDNLHNVDSLVSTNDIAVQPVNELPTLGKSLIDSTRAGTLPRSRHRLRTGLLASSSLLTLGATYVYLEKKWWSEGYMTFHFDDGRDFRYASNLDKFGHLLGGVFTADVYYAGLRWAGMPQRRAEWWALGATAFVQVSIEFKDGFSPRYGFSWADVAAGTLGGFWPMLQHRSSFLRDSQLKFSYWQRTDKYFDHRGIKRQAFSIDDYINQTYWFSFSPAKLLGTSGRAKWPAWLQVSVGVGLDANTWSPTRNGEGGLWEIYVAPDIDLVRLFRPKKPLLRSVLHVLNYIKVPMPTLQLAPRPRLWGLYF